jgi:CheY-like chemotaxis protein/signal transduction histidine kinase
LIFSTAESVLRVLIQPLITDSSMSYKMSVRFFKQYPLLIRLVSYVLGFSLLLAFILSALQLWLTHNNELDDIRQNLVELQGSQADSLIKNLWNMDQEGIDIQLQSMLQYSDVIAVVLTDSYGDTFQSGNIPENRTDLIVNSFILSKQFRDRSLELGTVSIYASPDRLKDRLWQRVPISLVTELIVLFLTGAFILGLFLLKFNRHINRIAKFAVNLEISTLDHELHLDRKKSAYRHQDELDRIVSSLNEMRRRLKNGVSAQQQTENQLQREIVFSDAIINSLPGLFVVYDEEMKAILFNNMYQEKLASPQGDVVENQFVDRVVPEDREKFSQAIQDVFITRQPLSIEVEMLSLDNDRAPYLINGSFFEHEGKRYFIGMSSDISEQKKIEDGLRQAQKIEVIGTLAGGIAHDFNNILAAIMGNLQLAQASFSAPEKLKEYLQSGLDASFRARDLVEQILSISRRGQQKKQPLQVALVMKEVVKLLRATIPTTIDIKYELECDRFILADATQIHQVILNLCTNGYHAMQETGGCLTISLTEKTITEIQHLPSLDLPVGQYLRIEISDTGCGMDKATQKMIFEPYFTTKKSGAGTGLGLAVVHGIVQGHDGHITVYSEPGRGTSFRLFFPLLADQDFVSDVNVELPEISGGSESILLVDDEQDILDVVSELIRLQGYSVTTFADSREALHHFRNNPFKFDLVITDMTMPNLSGEFLGKKIMAFRPEIPVILCTGFSKTIGSKQCLEDGFAAYLTKPLEAQNLLRTIREILDASSGSRLDILLVDDDIFNQNIVTLLLESQGHQVIVADNGERGLQKLAEHNFDLIFMDMQMPVLDGLQTTEIIRDCEKNGMQSEIFEKWAGKKTDKMQGRHVPIIALTGNLDEESRRKCQQVGMDDFLAKPFTREAVNRIIQQILKYPGSVQVLSEDNNSVLSADEKSVNSEEDLLAIGMAHLQTVYPLEQEQLSQLLDESVRSLKQSIQEASKALAQNNPVVLASVAHKLKGTLMGLGLETQVGLARTLQLSAKNKDVGEYTSVFRQITRSLKSLIEKDVS